MSRRASALITLAMFVLSLATLGRAPRLPERVGDETLTMVLRETANRAAAGSL